MKQRLWKKTLIIAACSLSLLAAQAIAGGTHIPRASAEKVSISATKASKVTSFAKSLRGKVRYVYGVNNPRKYIFDCSSFVKYVFAKQGVKLKWGTSSQSKQGHYVAKKNLRKGDIIFFSGVKNRGKISHNGIYLGNGKFIHNTTGRNVKGVVISDLKDYSKRYITARRVL